MVIDRTKLDTFTLAYIEAALWSTNDESDESGGEPMDRNYSLEDISEETLAQMLADCLKFQRVCAEHIGDETKQAGLDFWLTRNGHGSGFWDGDWPEPQATALDELSKHFGSYDLYIGDDGKVWGSP